ncbi:MAG: hypothetical protein KDD61_05455 [Bdellovibrionales bacterium]|nr:hypothetical protein [Bdellovibrionales bacterium]
MKTNKLILAGAALSGLMMATSTQSLADNHEKGHGKKAAQEMTGECHGVNACKGKSACHTDHSDCAGHNSCKGKGWLKMSEKECTAKKGTFKEG